LGKSERQKRFEEICEVGDWVSNELGRHNGSRVGRAMKGKRERARVQEAKKRAKEEKAKL
jgi:hypothetical protein